MSFLIRKADEKDVPDILRLIKELATYERAPEAVLNTEEMVLADGFGPKAIFKGFVAEQLDTNEIIGIAIYYTAYSTWKGRMFYLDDLFVTESFRRFGVGKMLLDAVLKDAQHEGVNLVKWQVLDWNTPAIDFYKKMNVVFDKGWIDCKIYKREIEAYVKTLHSI